MLSVCGRFLRQAPEKLTKIYMIPEINRTCFDALGVVRESRCCQQGRQLPSRKCSMLSEMFRAMSAKPRTCSDSVCIHLLRGRERAQTAIDQLGVFECQFDRACRASIVRVAYNREGLRSSTPLAPSPPSLLLLRPFAC